LQATRAAVKEGILPGGGVALVCATKALAKLHPDNDDQRTGIEIVRKALSWLARHIALNSGQDDSPIVAKILENDTYASGFDAQSGEFGNMIATAGTGAKRADRARCSPDRRPSAATDFPVFSLH
jgi:chaperonin GroEL